MNATQERWLPIPGFEGFYEVSDQGRVRSVDRLVPVKGSAPRWTRGKVLSPGNTGWGRSYKFVQLSVHGVSENRYVHHVVLAAFRGEHPGEGYNACHNNGDPADNRLSNLRYATVQANNDDKKTHGTSGLGEKNSMARLTEDQVRQVRRRLASGEPDRSIAESFGVRTSTVGCIRRGRSWAWLD